MLEHLVEHLGGVALPQSSAGPPRSPARRPRRASGGRPRLRQRPPPSARASAEAARSFSNRRAWFSCTSSAGEHVQPPAVVARLDDLRIEPQPVALVVATSSISSTSKPSSFSLPQPFVDPVGSCGRRPPRASARPERARSARRARRPSPWRPARRWTPELRLDVGSSPATFSSAIVEVVAALAVGEARDASRPSRRRRDRPPARPRRAGRACSRASSRPRRSRPGAGARAARRARRAASRSSAMPRPANSAR